MLHELIARFGLPAVFVGSAVEGEAFAIAGGLLAQHALAPLWAAIALAAAGGYAVDIVWFMLGRRHRDHPRVRAVSRRPAFRKALRLIERHPHAAIPLFRFAYGIRAVAPVAVGVSDISARRYFVVDLIASIAWGTIFTLFGWAFGSALPSWVAYLSVAGCILGLVFLGGGLVWPGRRAREDEA